MFGKNSTKHINDIMNKSVSESVSPSTIEEVNQKLDLDVNAAYVKADSFISNPYGLLGKVIQLRKKSAKDSKELIHPNFQIEFTISPIPNVGIDESSKISTPILNESIVVDSTIANQHLLLSFIANEWGEDDFYSMISFEQVKGKVNVNEKKWLDTISEWKQRNLNLINDPDIPYLLVVSGFNQKTILGRKYKKYEIEKMGGAYGLNINGELATSDGQIFMTSVFGITIGILKRPDTKYDFLHTLLVNPLPEESELFASLTGSVISNLVFKK